MVSDGLEIAGEIASRGIAIAGSLGKTPLEDPSKRLRHRRIDLVDGTRIVPKDRGERLRRRGAAEGRLAGQHLVEDASERKLVGSRRRFLSSSLFGRHVAESSDRYPRRREPSGCRRGLRVVARVQAKRCEPEVEDLHASLGRHEDVRRLEVAVNDARFVRARDAVGELRGQVEEAPERHRLSRQRSGDGLSIDQLHREVVNRRLAAGDRCGARFVHDHDVRVVQGRGGARLPLESSQKLRVFGVLFPENLQGDVAPEPAVARAVDLSHAPAPQRSHDLVGTESGSRGQDHRSLRSSDDRRGGRARDCTHSDYMYGFAVTGASASRMTGGGDDT